MSRRTSHCSSSVFDTLLSVSGVALLALTVGVLAPSPAAQADAPPGGLTGKAKKRILGGGGGGNGAPFAILPTRRSDGNTSRIRTLDADGVEVGRYDGFNGNEYVLPDVDVVRAGTRLLVTSYDANAVWGHFMILNVADSSQVQRFDLLGGEHPVEGVDMITTPDNAYAALVTYRTGGASGAIRIYDLAAAVEHAVHVFSGNEYVLPQIDPVLTPAADKLLLPTYDANLASGHLRIVDMPSGTLHAKIDLLGSEHPVPGVDVVVTPDDQTAVLATYASGGAIGRVHFIDIPSGTVQSTFVMQGSEYPLPDVDPVLSPDGSQVAVPTYQAGGASGRLLLFDVLTGTLSFQVQFLGNEHPITAVDAVYSPDGSRVVIPTYQALLARGHLHIVDTATGTEIMDHLFDANEYPLVEVDAVFTPDGSKLLLPTYDNFLASSHLRIIDMPGGVVSTRLDLEDNEYPIEGVDIVVSPDSQTAYLPTYRPLNATGRLRFIDIGAAQFDGQIDFDADEYPIQGCDVILAGSRLLFPTYRPGFATGRLRCISRLTQQIVWQFDYDANEYPQAGVDVRGMSSPPEHPDEDWHVSGAVPPPPGPMDYVPPPPPPTPPGS